MLYLALEGAKLSSLSCFGRSFHHGFLAIGLGFC